MLLVYWCAWLDVLGFVFPRVCFGLRCDLVFWTVWGLWLAKYRLDLFTFALLHLGYCVLDLSSLRYVWL